MHCTAAALSAGAIPAEVVMQIYQGNFVADVEPIKSKRTSRTTPFRIRVRQLRPVDLLIYDSIATDANAPVSEPRLNFESFCVASA